MEGPFSVHIKSLKESERPREKLLLHGTKSLSNSELLAILLGSGTKGNSAISIAQQLLSQHRHDLYQLSISQPSQWKKIKGMGKARAIMLSALFELAIRIQNAEQPEAKTITSSEAAFRIFKEQLLHLKHEEFWVLYLNRRNQVLSTRCISKGGVSGTLVDAKMVFAPAIELMASALIIGHNHPSGNLEPSEADKGLTQKLVSGAKLLDLRVLDHLILGGRNYLSFSDRGLIP